MDEPTIRSRTHPVLKQLGAVRAGREPGLVVLEGERLVRDALASGVVLEHLLVSERREEWAREWAAAGVVPRLVDDDVLAQRSSLERSPGVIALARVPRSRTVDELPLDPNAFVLAIAGVGDPGNLGALARCAEALGARAVAVARGGCSPWNEKALRGSMGSLLRLPLVHDVDASALARSLTKRGARHLLAATRGGVGVEELGARTAPTVLWVGGETGEDPKLGVECERVTLPMSGAAESLNVAVAAALLMWELGRASRERRA